MNIGTFPPDVKWPDDEARAALFAAGNYRSSVQSFRYLRQHPHLAHLFRSELISMSCHAPSMPGPRFCLDLAEQIADLFLDASVPEVLKWA